MTTKEEIKSWLERGKKEAATHVIVVCDTFSFENYPVFVSSKENVEKVYEEYCLQGIFGQRIMEIYNLSMSIEEQLEEPRCFNL